MQSAWCIPGAQSQPRGNICIRNQDPQANSGEMSWRVACLFLPDPSSPECPGDETALTKAIDMPTADLESVTNLNPLLTIDCASDADREMEARRSICPGLEQILSLCEHAQPNQQRHLSSPELVGDCHFLRETQGVVVILRRWKTTQGSFSSDTRTTHHQTDA